MTVHWQTVIFFVRHGQTDLDYSLDPNTDGQRQLTELGRRQLQAVGEYLAQFAPTAVYASPLDRCQESARIIIEQLRSKPTLQTERSLIEIYRHQPLSVAEQQGATFLDLAVSRHPGEQIVAVTHQYIIGHLVAEFNGRPYQQVPCDFAAVYRLVLADSTVVEATHLQPAAKIN